MQLSKREEETGQRRMAKLLGNSYSDNLPVQLVSEKPLQATTAQKAMVHSIACTDASPCLVYQADLLMPSSSIIMHHVTKPSQVCILNMTMSSVNMRGLNSYQI